MSKIFALIEGSTSVSGILKILKDFGPWAYAAIFGFTYLSGFVVLNSNLAKSDVLDVEFVNARYLLAGSNFIFYLICFYLFAGRAALFGPRWLDRDIRCQQHLELKRGWRYLNYIHSFIHALYFCCISAALYTFFAIRTVEVIAFNASLAAAFVISFLIDRTDGEIHRPRITILAKIVTKLTCVVAFFAIGSAETMLVVFVQYFGIMLYINMMLYVSKRYEQNFDHIAFTAIYAAFFIVTTAIIYGTQVFGQVSPKVGGARPLLVSVGLKEGISKTLPRDVSMLDQQILTGTLIHQTPSHLYLLSQGRMMRLRAEDVITITSKPEPEKIKAKDVMPRFFNSVPG